MLEVLRELVDVLAALRGIDGNKQAELHARLDQETEAAPAAKPKPAPDVPAGA